ncbi:MAG: hypothetical protein EXS64_16785 [Candidatus Latescibacteria bacterium]|nr:hypothetical protein [Candidatus Latescibacterota bacterium]
MEPRLRRLLRDGRRLTYVGREEAASPAIGHFAAHQKEQEAIVNQALSL